MMRISLARWCHQYFGPKWTIEEMCRVAKQVGADGIELADPSEWRVIEDHGLQMPLALMGKYADGSEPFERGWNDLAFRPQVMEATCNLIAASEKANNFVPQIIAFSGNTVAGQDIQTSLTNCVDGIKLIEAELKAAGMTLAFEFLNAKIALPMRGHPGYEARMAAYARRVSEGVGPTCRSLFDVYHRQIEEGDVIGGIQRHGPVIGHFHVAGLPKDASILPRGEMNVGEQLVDWKEVGLAARTYASDAYVGLEFMPTEGRDHIADIAAAIKMLRG